MINKIDIIKELEKIRDGIEGDNFTYENIQTLIKRIEKQSNANNKKTLDNFFKKI